MHFVATFKTIHLQLLETQLDNLDGNSTKLTNCFLCLHSGIAPISVQMLVTYNYMLTHGHQKYSLPMFPLGTVWRRPVQRSSLEIDVETSVQVSYPLQGKNPLQRSVHYTLDDHSIVNAARECLGPYSMQRATASKSLGRAEEADEK